MTRAIAAMAGNHVAAKLLMLLLVLGGLYAARTLTQDIFPDMGPETVNVVVAYPGATPTEVEDAIVLPIELAVAEVDYVKRIRASARESVGSVSLELINENDVDIALEEVKNAVDRIRTFPEEAERPEIMRVSRRTEVMDVYVYVDTTERALLETAESVRDEASRLPKSPVEATAVPRVVELPTAGFPLIPSWSVLGEGGRLSFRRPARRCQLTLQVLDFPLLTLVLAS